MTFNKHIYLTVALLEFSWNNNDWLVKDLDHVTTLPSKSEKEKYLRKTFCVILITERCFYSADRSEDRRAKSRRRLDQSAISVDQFYFMIGDNIGSKVFGHRVPIEVKWTFHSSLPQTNSVPNFSFVRIANWNAT